MPTITIGELTTLKIAKRSHPTVKSRLAIAPYATEHGQASGSTGWPRERLVNSSLC